MIVGDLLDRRAVTDLLHGDPDRVLASVDSPRVFGWQPLFWGATTPRRLTMAAVEDNQITEYSLCIYTQIPFTIDAVFRSILNSS